MKYFLCTIIAWLVALVANAQCTIMRNGIVEPCNDWEGYGVTSTTKTHFPILRVRVSVHVIQDGSGQGNFVASDPTHTAFIQKVIDSVNVVYQNFGQQSALDPAYPSPLVQDTRIRFVLDSIYYHQNTYLSEGHPDKQDSTYRYFVKNNPAFSSLLKQRDSTIHIFTPRGCGMAISSGDKRNVYSPGWYQVMNNTCGTIYVGFSDLVRRLVAHEFGHNFMLLHPRSPEDIEDTPVRGPSENNNLMEYGTETSITLEQCALMRFGLLGGQDVSDCVIRDWCAFNSANNITISSGTYTWIDARYFGGNLTLNSGVTVTIKSKISMPPGGKIFVEEGATLIIDGGTITNICGRMWGGIVVKGTYTGTRNTTNVGTLILQNHGTIEHAELGVKMGDNALDGCGYLTATDFNFKNCKESIYFAPCNTPLETSIQRCNFTCDAILRDNPYQAVAKFVYLTYVKDVRFSGDTFSNTVAHGSILTSFRGYGIESLNSTLSIVQDGPDEEIDGCLYPQGARNYFNRLSTGIRFKGNPGDDAAKVLIMHSDFYNCQRGIHGWLSDSPTIWQNSYVVDPNLEAYSGYEDTAIGILTDTCLGLNIRENDIFFDSFQPGVGSLYCVGFLARYTDAGLITPAPSVIYRNRVLNIKYDPGDANQFTGVFTEMDNKELEIFCNTFSDLDIDMDIHGGLKDQGSSGTPARNKFSTGASMHIQHSPGSFGYYFINTAPYIPTNKSGVTLSVASNSDTTCDSICFQANLPRMPIVIDNRDITDQEQEFGYFTLYPNPSEGNISLEYMLPEGNEQAQMVVYDMSGKLIYQTTISNRQGAKHLRLIAKPGIYYCRIWNGNRILHSSKFIISQ